MAAGQCSVPGEVPRNHPRTDRLREEVFEPPEVAGRRVQSAVQPRAATHRG